MNTLKKMQLLSDSAQFDLCDYNYQNMKSSENLPGIYQSTGHGGCKYPIFKTLMTNKCSNDCKYCINQSKRDFTRASLEPEDVTKVFLDYYEKGLVEGLFLSSGIDKDEDKTMERIVETARLLRMKHGFDGYIHLKIIPGASRDIIKRAMNFANRVSVNIEAATPDGLAELSSTKDYQKDLLSRIRWIRKFNKRDPSKYAPSGQTTQIIVGANDEDDVEVLNRVKWLYDKMDLKRSYFSIFQSEVGTELEKQDNCDSKRGVQLYHADALVSRYRYRVEELAFNNGYLSLDKDPKVLAALQMDMFPVEINTARFSQLIRVPGIGEKSARDIIKLRKQHPFRNIDDLGETPVVVERAEPFIKINGSYQSSLDPIIKKR